MMLLVVRRERVIWIVLLVIGNCCLGRLFVLNFWKSVRNWGGDMGFWIGNDSKRYILCHWRFVLQDHALFLSILIL